VTSVDAHDPNELLERPQFEQIQVQRLRWAIEQAARSPYCGKQFADLKLGPDSPQTLDQGEFEAADG